MKPAPGDKKYSIHITGRELAELKKFTWSMVEAFGLDRRIERYQGKRAIGFYRWDLDWVAQTFILTAYLFLPVLVTSLRVGLRGETRFAVFGLSCSRAF
jgi:hypothetical protein